MTLETKFDTAEWTRLKEVERLARDISEAVGLAFSDNKPVTRKTACGICLINKARELLKLTEASNGKA